MALGFADGTPGIIASARAAAAAAVSSAQAVVRSTPALALDVATVGAVGAAQLPAAVATVDAAQARAQLATLPTQIETAVAAAPAPVANVYLDGELIRPIAVDVVQTAQADTARRVRAGTETSF